jgi:hypothetical protein
MTSVVVENLDMAIRAVRELPEDAQKAIAHELLGRVDDFSSSRMNDVQRAEVKRRLARSREYALDEEVHAVFHCYNPAL